DLGRHAGRVEPDAEIRESPDLPPCEFQPGGLLGVEPPAPARAVVLAAIPLDDQAKLSPADIDLFFPVCPDGRVVLRFWQRETKADRAAGVFKAAARRCKLVLRQAAELPGAAMTRAALELEDEVSAIEQLLHSRLVHRPTDLPLG